MNISQAAAASGVSAKMIRHYEAIGLVPKPRRSGANYRTYADADVHMLRFVRAARDLGFSMAEIAELLDLWRDRRRPSRKVKALVNGHVRDLERRIARLQGMKGTLEALAEHCHGDERHDCPILERLEGGQ